MSTLSKLARPPFEESKSGTHRNADRRNEVTAIKTYRYLRF